MTIPSSRISSAYEAIEICLRELDGLDEQRQIYVNQLLDGNATVRRAVNSRRNLERQMESISASLKSAAQKFSDISTTRAKVMRQLSAWHPRPNTSSVEVIKPLEDYVELLSWVWMRPGAEDPGIPQFIGAMRRRLAAEGDCWNQWLADQRDRKIDQAIHPNGWKSRDAQDDMPEWQHEPNAPPSDSKYDLEQSRWVYWTLVHFKRKGMTKDNAIREYCKKYIGSEDAWRSKRRKIDRLAEHYIDWAKPPLCVTPHKAPLLAENE